MQTHEMRAASYYDGIASGYDEAMQDPRCVAARGCFWDQAARLLARPGRVLDFGAGTGIDAQHFAALGHEVTAFDVSPGMIERLKQRCPREVAAGRIRPVSGSLAELESFTRGAVYDLVISNFAVFSLIPEPKAPLELFARLLRPGGIALINLQNPLDSGDLRTLAFWKALLRAPGLGGIRYRSREVGTLFRHTPGAVARAARHHFQRVPVPLQAPCCRRSFGPFSHFRLVALRRR